MVSLAIILTITAEMLCVVTNKRKAGWPAEICRGIYYIV